MSLSSLKEHLRDERIWCVAARVALHNGETQHYDYAKNGQMIVSVRTLRHDVPVWAMLKGGGASVGVWFIPPIGTEVIVSFDDGMFEGDAYIVGIHGTAPTDLLPGHVMIQGDVVNICGANESVSPVQGEGVVIGTGIDPFTGQTYNALGSASRRVFAKKT